MKLNISHNNWQFIFRTFLFLCVIFIIILLLPTRNKFKYQFEVGKPWTYELITASFDFPIFKSEKQLDEEKLELLKNYKPFFLLDTAVGKVQMRKLSDEFLKKQGYPILYKEFIKNKFNSVYSKGVISATDYNNMIKEGKKHITCIYPDRLTRTISIEDLYTPKSAYKEFLNAGPEILKTYNLNLYLTESLKFDSVTSNFSKVELLKNLSLTFGMVQSGERIIDRGEIVTQESFLVLNSLKKEFENRKDSFHQSTLVIIGEIIIITGLIVLFFLYVYLFRPRIFNEIKNMILITILILLMIAITSFTKTFTVLNYYIVPFGLLPIMVRVFFDSRTALFAHIITILIISLMIDNSFQFILLQIFIGMVAVSSLKDMTQRSQLAQTALYIFVSYVIIYISFQFITEGDLNRIHWLPIVYFAISCVFLLFAYLLIYIFEKIFGMISAVTLVELTNVNNDLMMQFAEKAPGTFQHTLQVSNLATEAAKKIGSNSLLVRTGALYHDIGKMKNPDYFVENQHGGKNILSDKDYEEAARLIIKHVQDGVEIAKKNHLPEQIIHFITTHHGVSKTKYFYNSYINDHPDKIPNDEAFTYHGPLPDTKETAILMMADAVEARSRSLIIYTEENIDQMVDSMIDSQIADGQFKNAPISFRDVETVKNVFKEKIKNMYHNRIVYPEVKEN
ncbi:MAG: HDIG domain-containing protein [Paludibacter sp.]|nr:HDIG domain-containing protein [Paludibacter sp.]